MKQTVRVTTMNINNNPERIEERITVFLQENSNSPQPAHILLLQEVLHDRLDIYDSIAKSFGYTLVGSTNPPPAGIQRKPSGNATLSLVPVTKAMEIIVDVSHMPEGEKTKVVPVLATQHHFGKRPVITFNAHFPWGGYAEALRLEVAYQVSQKARELQEEYPEMLLILGGDFNAVLESDTLRYLHGLGVAKGSSTKWTSGWDIVEGAPFPTARKDGGWAERTALGKGIVYPETLPDRVIDGVMSFGWNYGGKIGTPMSLEKVGIAKIEGGDAISDHYGVAVDFII